MEHGKLDTWLRRERKAAARLRVLATEALSQGFEIASWTREEAFEDGTPLELVLTACADWCDGRGQSANFRIEWQRADGSPLTSCWHQHAALEEDGKAPSRDSLEADISTGKLIALLLRKDEQKDRLIVGSIAAIFAPLEHTIRLQQQIIEQQGKSLLRLNEQAIARADTESDRELTDEEREESRARSLAWSKLAEVGPLVLQAGIEHLIDRSRPNANGSGHA
jgi:hypothetical protein